MRPRPRSRAVGRPGDVADERDRARGPLVEEDVGVAVRVRPRHEVRREAEERDERAVRADRLDRADASFPAVAGAPGDVADERHRARGPLVEEDVAGRRSCPFPPRGRRDALERDEGAIRADRPHSARRRSRVPGAPRTWLTSVTVPVARS